MSKSRITSVALAVILSLTLVLPVLADTPQERPENRIEFANSYAAFKEVYMLPENGEHILTFTLEFHNGENRSLDFQDYFLRIESSAGERFTPKRLDHDDNQTLYAGTTQEYRYYVNTGDVSRLDELEFVFLKWNFSMPDFEQKLGQVKLSESDFAVAPAGVQAAFEWGELKMAGQITDVKTRLDEKEDELKITLDFDLKNAGAESIDYPQQMQFRILTSEGYLYPMTHADNGPPVVIRSQEKAELELEAAVPEKLQAEDWTLLVLRSVTAPDQTPVIEPAAFFKIPDSVPEPAGLVGQEKTYTNDDGTYTLTFSHIYRLPWEDEDIVAADIRVANHTDDTVPLPSLAGTFTLDNNVEIPADAVVADRVIGLQPGEEIMIHLTGKIPYTYTFSGLDIELQEVIVSEAGERRKEMAEFRHEGEFDDIMVVEPGDSYELSRTGRHFQIAVQDVHTFENEQSNIFAVMLAFENVQKRQGEPPALSAQLELADGSVYPLSITRPQEKSGPGGIALLELWTSLPKTVVTDNATILVGEAVSGTTVAVSDTQADGFVNPVVYHLPEEKTTVTGDLENIRIAPYTLSLSEIKIPAIFQNEVKFKFDYELQKDLLVQAYTANDRILIEVEDPEGEVWLEKTYALEQANPEAGLEALELGSDTIELVEMFDALSINRSHYRINVYHQLDTGHKKLLASREFAWRNN